MELKTYEVPISTSSSKIYIELLILTNCSQILLGTNFTGHLDINFLWYTIKDRYITLFINKNVPAKIFSKLYDILWPLEVNVSSRIRLMPLTAN